ncbi:MAG: hypothetical protein FWC15_00930 [Fibromonadales bacterium]|nr:hypothetical protein [Fibromonadales bacterium]
MNKFNLIAVVVAMCAVYTFAAVSDKCQKEITALPNTKKDFNKQDFSKDLLLSVVKVQASCKVKITCPKDDKKTDVGLTVGCVKQLPNDAEGIQALLKDIGMEAGTSAVAPAAAPVAAQTPAAQGLTFAEFLSQKQAVAPEAATPEAAAVPSVPQPPPPPARFPNYEAFLDSIEIYLGAILPEKEKLNIKKEEVKAETTSPKDEFESTAAYEQRLANFEKTKQQKIAVLEQEYQSLVKTAMDKLKAGITFKDDIQPNWEGMLKKDGDVEEYKGRINKFSDKISAGTARNDMIVGSFVKLEFGAKEGEDLAKHWFGKKQLYISRLEKARELMRDYIIQEQSKIINTGKQKPEMVLGAYDADKEEFEFSASNAQSQTVPFDFGGIIKMSSLQARETNRQTDNFTVSVDYVNYPLIADNGAKLYPGVKKANVFYKDQEIAFNGKFKVIPGLDKHSGFMEWVIYTDSLLTGKLSSRNLDSLYAMDIKASAAVASATESSGSDFSLSGRTAFRIAMFGLSAASVGLGLWQNGEVDTKGKNMKKAYENAHSNPTPENYGAYNKSKDELNTSEKLRTVFYGSAIMFCAAGIVSFYF